MDVFWYMCAWVSLGYGFKSGDAESWLLHRSRVKPHCQRWKSQFICLLRVYGSSLCSTSYWHLLLLDFKIFFNLLNENLYGHVVYIFISLVTNGGEHLSVCSLTTEISSFVKCLIHLLLIFPSFFVFFLFICKSTLYIEYTCSLLVIHITFILLFVCSLFLFLNALSVNKIYLF